MRESILDDEFGRVGGDMWLRPEKFKIALSFIQIFAEFKRNYGIKWPEATAEYMRRFAGFNLDILQIAATECIEKTSYYFGLQFVTIFPFVIGVALACIVLYGRALYHRRLQKIPRKCVKSGQPILEWIPESKFMQMRQVITRVALQDAYHHFAKVTDEMVTAEMAESMRSKLSLKASGYQIMNAPASVQKGSQEHQVIIRTNVAVWKKRILLRMNHINFNNKTFKLFFWMLLLAYPSVSVRVMRIFNCREFGFTSKQGDVISEHRIAQFLETPCYDSTWDGYLGLAVIAMLLFVIGIPVLFFVMLYRARENGIAWKWRCCQDNEHLKKHLIGEARADAEISNEFFQEPINSAEERACVTRFLRRLNFRGHRTYSSLGFIYFAYSDRCWWYEVVELSRKLFLNGIICLIYPGSISQVVFGAFICFVYLIAVTSIYPYKTASDQYLAVACHVQLFVTLICGLCLKASIPFMGQPIAADPELKRQQEQSLVEGVVIASHALILVSFVLSVIYEKYSNGEQVKLDRAIAIREQKLKEARKMIKKNRRKQADDDDYAPKAAEGRIANMTGQKLATWGAVEPNTNEVLNL